MKNILIILLASGFGLTIQAQEKKSRSAKYDVEVNGNCEQCKKRIEKAAYSVPGVKSAVWHMDDHKLHLIINEEKTSVSQVKMAVAKAGHDAGDIKATDEDYKSLHHCCLYERK